MWKKKCGNAKNLYLIAKLLPAHLICSLWGYELLPCSVTAHSPPLTLVPCSNTSLAFSHSKWCCFSHATVLFLPSLSVYSLWYLPFTLLARLTVSGRAWQLQAGWTPSSWSNCNPCAPVLHWWTKGDILNTGTLRFGPSSMVLRTILLWIVIKVN